MGVRQEGGLPRLTLLFKPYVEDLHDRWQTNGRDVWPCVDAPWPRAAFRGHNPGKLFIYLARQTVCVVGIGWSNRAESTAEMLMAGILEIHDALAAASPQPAAFRFREFGRVVEINLHDAYERRPHRLAPATDLAYACKHVDPRGCDVGLVPHFIFGNYMEVGIGEFPAVSRRLAAAGNQPARQRLCAWVGNRRNHEQRARFIERAAKLPELFASPPTDQYISLRAQVEEWACLVDLVGFGFSARLPLLLHSARVVLKVTSPAPGPWLWYENPWAFPEALTPWKHFVPVHANLSDLVEKAMWIKDHPRESDQIGLAGQAYARRYLTRRRASEYLARQVLIAGQCRGRSFSNGSMCSYDWVKSSVKRHSQLINQSFWAGLLEGLMRANVQTPFPLVV